ncbi:HTH-type transcriptional regulator CdhR [compost metagenome]
MRRAPQTLRTRRIRHVTLLAFENSLEMSIAMARDIFHAASTIAGKELRSPRARLQDLVKVATLDGKPVKTFSGAYLTPDVSISDIDRTDLIIVSGVWGSIDDFIRKHQSVVEWIRQQYAKKAIMASFTTGTFLLAEAGILDGKVATVYWRMAAEFRAKYPNITLQPERNITSADNIFCSTGVNSAMEMALYLIEKIWGHASAERISQTFYMDVPREHSEFLLSFDEQKRHNDDKILAAQQWLESNFASEILLEEVAGRMGMGLRSFMRRFKNATGETPVQYLQKVRVGIAKELILHTSLSIDEISYRVGYRDVSFFCRVFKRLEKSTPGAYKKVHARLAHCG